jgi:transposase
MESGKMSDKKNKGGRPTKYKEEYCDKVIEVMREGASKVEFCAEIGISYNTFLSWQDENPEFMTSVKTGDMMCQAWWEKKGRQATFNSEGFNATSYIFNMKNRFKDDWRDKQEVDNKHSGSVANVNYTPEEYAKAEQRLKDMGLD